MTGHVLVRLRGELRIERDMHVGIRQVPGVDHALHEIGRMEASDLSVQEDGHAAVRRRLDVVLDQVHPRRIQENHAGVVGTLAGTRQPVDQMRRNHDGSFGELRHSAGPRRDATFQFVKRVERAQQPEHRGHAETAAVDREQRVCLQDRLRLRGRLRR